MTLTSSIDTMDQLPEYCEVLDTDYGRIVVNKYDTAQTGFYRHSRNAINHHELVQLEGIFREHAANHPLYPPSTSFSMIDVGANIGTWGLYFRHMSELSIIVMIEPLRAFYDMIRKTVELNEAADKLWPIYAAVGAQAGKIQVPEFDWTKPTNFGGIELGEQQREFIGQARTGMGETVELITLDEAAQALLPQLVIKIDVEGMEADVLRGARSLIMTHRPILFVEFLKSDQDELRQLFDELGYTVEKWHTDFLARPRP